MAEEPAHPQTQHDPPARYRGVGHPTVIPAVHSSGRLGTAIADRWKLLWPGHVDHEMWARTRELAPAAVTRDGFREGKNSISDETGTGIAEQDAGRPSPEPPPEPRRPLGRMNAASRTILLGIGPLGGIVGGLLGASIGLRPTLWLAAFGYLLTLVPVLLSPIPGLRELPPSADSMPPEVAT